PTRRSSDLSIVPDQMEDYTTSIDVVIDHPALTFPEADWPAVSPGPPDQPPAARLVLDREGRFALRIAERLCGDRVLDRLSEPVGQVIDDVMEDVEDAVPISVGDFDTRSHLHLHTIPTVELACDTWEFDERRGLTLTFAVTVHADFEASTIVTDEEAATAPGQLE